MATKISTAELKQKVENGEKIYLIDTLAPRSFEVMHIPSSLSIPYDTDFVEQFQKQVTVAKDAEIITYCASDGCQLSALAARVLEEAGYTNVKHYVDGLAGWKNAGLTFESSAK